MVYKKGPPYRVRPVQEIKKELDQAKEIYGPRIRTMFFPAGNTIAMPTDQLADICRYARSLFSELERITVYGSSKYIYKKGIDGLKQLQESGLSRIHVGLESGDDEILRRIKKGSTAAQQIEAGLWVREAGLELSEYVVLGIGGRERTMSHAFETARALNAVNPDFIRFRTFLPKIDTLLLHQIRNGRFQVLTPHEVLKEAQQMIRKLAVTSEVRSDHYTNYINIHGRMAEGKDDMLRAIDEALERDEDGFRPVYVGRE
jgi:radical SAM superfamily enzyme YgiQ (UPF0313 family)